MEPSRARWASIMAGRSILAGEKRPEARPLESARLTMSSEEPKVAAQPAPT